jgi:hypothetical protein
MRQACRGPSFSAARKAARSAVGKQHARPGFPLARAEGQINPGRIIRIPSIDNHYIAAKKVNEVLPYRRPATNFLPVVARAEMSAPSTPPAKLALRPFHRIAYLSFAQQPLSGIA